MRKSLPTVVISFLPLAPSGSAGTRPTVRRLTDNVLEIVLIGQGAVEGDGRGLDGDATFLFVRSGIRRPSLTGLAGRDNTGLGQQGVGQSGLAVVDVRNDGHVAHVRGLVCDGVSIGPGGVCLSACADSPIN